MKSPHILTIDALLDDPACRSRPVVDVRTPAEFAEDHLPGAVNYPVLSDEERVLVGTLARQAGAFDANVKGAALVAANIAALLAGPLAGMPRTWDPVLYCWRGGSRSWSLSVVLARIGWRTGLLDGGYRSYRRRIVADLDRLAQALSFTVVAGATGSGKTRVLHLAAQRGAQVLDLEALASHRGSVLGSVPGSPQPAQKAFDAALWRQLRDFDPARPVLVESESRKIGQLHLPASLMARMRASPCVRLEVAVDVRVNLLRRQYPHLEDEREQIGQRLEKLLPLYQDKRVEEWLALARAGCWEGLVARLLREHYDPAYQRSMLRNYALVGQAPVIVIESADENCLADAADNLLLELALDRRA